MATYYPLRGMDIRAIELRNYKAVEQLIRRSTQLMIRYLHSPFMYKMAMHEELLATENPVAYCM